jgi:hypothetical protein
VVNDQEDEARRAFSMTRKQWFSLPLRLRRRWWRDTDYNRLPPTDKLIHSITTQLALAEADHPPEH